MNPFIIGFYVITLLSSIILIVVTRLMKGKKKISETICAIFIVVLASYHMLESANIITNVSYECMDGIVYKMYIDSNFYFFIRFCDLIMYLIVIILICSFYKERERLRNIGLDDKKIKELLDGE